MSVTQQFNTTSSMGRLTLNVLLSFAQFEREVTEERIRDKIAASKRKGMWMGGIPPIGYVPHERSLAVDPQQADRVRQIFQRYLALGCVSRLKAEADRCGWVTPERITRRQGQQGGRPFSRGHLYRILGNPVYLGRIVHRGEVHQGTHPPLIKVEVWEGVKVLLAKNRQGAKRRAGAKQPSLLAGLIFDEEDRRLVPSHAQKGSRRYRYYVREPVEGSPALRVPAKDLEAAVVAAVLDRLGMSVRWWAR